MGRALSFLLLGSFMQTLSCYPFFQSRLPNGNFIPHPCKPNFVWKGVGHAIVLGGGPQNPFGKDFAANGFVSCETHQHWSLCYPLLKNAKYSLVTKCVFVTEVG